MNEGNQAKNKKELPTDRLATTDEQGRRLYLYTSDVKGKFKKFRFYFQFFLIFIFLGLPWVRIGGHQSVLLDLVHRRFMFFGVSFWAHEAPLLVFFFIGFALVIAFITSVWGRVWCGWTCPQTVFINMIFSKIERWIEGDHVARKILDLSDWNSDKFLKKMTKWILFLLCALVIAHSFLAYFVGTNELFKMTSRSPIDNPKSFLVMLFAAGITLLDFGWFREQFCIIVCPYGRFQSVLMDDRSLAVLYDHHRGEPRAATGDCINCYKCVQVCPTGIDIRRGVQLECIACTACIDACDEVMSKIHKPKGLIRYSNREGIDLNKSIGWKSQLLRSRSLIYAGLLMFVLSGLAFALITRELVDFDILRGKEAPYQVIPISNGKSIITNHFQVETENKSMHKIEVRYSLSESDNKMGIELVMINNPIYIQEGKMARSDIFMRAPLESLKFGRVTVLLNLAVRSIGGEQSFSKTYVKEIRIVGPVQ